MHKIVVEKMPKEVMQEIVVSESIQCNKCGREFVNPLSKGSTMERFIWDANIHGYKTFFSYGSKFDMQEWEFHLCDDCLVKMIKGFSVPVDVIKHNFSG